jgi:hypothetical protein
MPVEWTQPPKVARSKTAWDEVADQLRSRPGEWARVARAVSPATATAIKNGIIVAFRPPGTFDATTGERDKAKNRCDVYARFVGDEAGS